MIFFCVDASMVYKQNLVYILSCIRSSKTNWNEINCWKFCPMMSVTFSMFWFVIVTIQLATLLSPGLYFDKRLLHQQTSVQSLSSVVLILLFPKTDRPRSIQFAANIRFPFNPLCPLNSSPDSCHNLLLRSVSSFELNHLSHRASEPRSHFSNTRSSQPPSHLPFPTPRIFFQSRADRISLFSFSAHRRPPLLPLALEERRPPFFSAQQTTFLTRVWGPGFIALMVCHISFLCL